MKKKQSEREGSAGTVYILKKLTRRSKHEAVQRMDADEMWIIHEKGAPNMWYPADEFFWMLEELPVEFMITKTTQHKLNAR